MKNFTQFNILNSKSLDDVLRYTTASANLSNLPKDKNTIIDYFTIAELQHADDWNLEHFNYEINPYGFRFVNNKTTYEIAAFGCSFTFGVGLPAKSLWHQLLGEKKKKDVANFGLPGSSALTAIELFLITSNHIEMQTVILLLPSMHRMQIAKKHPIQDEVNLVSIIPGQPSKMAQYYNIEAEEIFKYIPDEEKIKQLRDHLYLADMMSGIRNIKLFISSWDEDTYQLLESMEFKNTKILPAWKSDSKNHAENDLARDKLHPGIDHHRKFSDLVADLI